MKKGVFIILFVLISMPLLYYPNYNFGKAESPNLSPDCFSSSTQGFVSNAQDKISLSYNYETTPTTNWKANALGQFFIQDLTAQDELFERVLSTSLVNSLDNCNAYSFEFQRAARTLSYEIPLKEKIDSEGTSYCVYQLTDEITNDLEILGGTPTTLSQICPSLQNGVELNSSQDCPATATCEVEINQGQQENYLLGVSSDTCGNYFVERINEGNPVEDVSAKANEFITQCVAREKAGSSAARIATNAQTGSNENTQTTGNTNENQVVSGCVAFFQLFQQQPDTEQKKNCGNGVLESDKGEECDEGTKNGDNWWCSKDCKFQLPSFCNRPISQYCEACREYKMRFGWDKTKTGEEEDKKWKPVDCSFTDPNRKIQQTPVVNKNCQNCKWYDSGGFDPGNPSGDNWAWGLCLNGKCELSLAAINACNAIDGKTRFCRCDCYKKDGTKYAVGMNEFCEYDSDPTGLLSNPKPKMCTKRDGKISEIFKRFLESGNVCELRSGHCQAGDYIGKGPREARELCETKGKFFYMDVNIGDNICYCIDDPCKVRAS